MIKQYVSKSHIIIVMLNGTVMSIDKAADCLTESPSDATDGLFAVHGCRMIEP